MEVTSLNPLVDMVLKVTMGKLRDMEEEATDLNLKDMEEEEATTDQATVDQVTMVHQLATDLHMEEISKQVDTMVPQVTVVPQVTMVPHQATDLHTKETSKQVDQATVDQVTVVPQVTMVDHQATPPNKIMAEAPTVALQATRNKDTVKDMEEEAIIRDTEVGTVGQKKRK
jgi:hypothetical protein